MPKIQALYRAWRGEGDRVLWSAHSTTLRDARSHGCSAIEVELLNRQYLQLTGTMNRDVSAKRGAKRRSRQVGPRLRRHLQTLSHPWLPMSANHKQPLEPAYFAAFTTRRRRSVPALRGRPCPCHCTNDGVNDPAAVPRT